MLELIILLIIAVTSAYFGIIYYLNNKMFIHIVLSVVLDRTKDYVYEKVEILYCYYQEYKFEAVRWVLTAYRRAVRRFKR